MPSTAITSPRAILYLFLAIFLFLLHPVAKAERYHVRTSGTKISGPCAADNWSFDNCYPDILLASTVAAPGDSILLFSENHHLDSSTSLPVFLGNMDMDPDWSQATIIFSPEAQLKVLSGSSAFTALGLTITSDGSDSHLAGFLLEGDFSPLANIVFSNCFFSENRGSDANYGGGSCISAKGSGGGASLAVSSCLFSDNINRGRGGAVFIGEGYEVEIQDTDFLNNFSMSGVSMGEGRGGAIALVSPGEQSRLHITNTRFNGNKAWGPGGTIFIDDGSLALLDSELNTSESAVDFVTEWSAGAGILMRRTGGHLDTVYLTVDHCLFDGNLGNLDTNPWAGDGGAILVKGINDRYVDVNVIDCTFQNNYNAQGAGLYIGRFANGNVTRCRFLNNTAFLQGGAAFKGGAFYANLGEVAVYSYCEFTGNRAGLDIFGNQSTELGRGGAFSTRLYPRGEFYNCTFYNNEAHGPYSQGDAIMLPREGGTFNNDLQRCLFVNTVFYGEAGNSLQIISDDGAISQISNCAFEAGEVQTGGISAGGTVHLTGSPFQGNTSLYPGPGSPLLDVALETGQTLDLMGNAVPSGAGPDIGAYEGYGIVSVPELNPGLNQLSASPNPFNPQTILKYELSKPGAITLIIYDAAGRRVKTLIHSYQAQGLHQILWKGNNDQGRSMPSGVYFASLRGNDKFTTSKLTLVR